MENFRHSIARLSRALRFGIVIPLFVAIVACTDAAPRGGGDILVLGDSVMAWNGSAKAAIPDVMARELGRTVVNKAVPGAQFDNSSVIAGAVGFDIQRQFPGGRWNLVVMNGGANDLGADCGCGVCGPVVDQLIGKDAKTGSIPAFVQQVRMSSGANIVWMGYYAGNGKGSFKGCRDDLVEMEARLARYAASQPAFQFIDSEDVIDRTDSTLFASDNTHPSAKGSARIGAYLAQRIKAQ